MGHWIGVVLGWEKHCGLDRGWNARGAEADTGYSFTFSRPGTEAWVQSLG